MSLGQICGLSSQDFLHRTLKLHYCYLSEYNKPTKSGKLHNVLPVWGNEQTMNLNPLILANIQGSSYFKGR